jgi:hypothetical protein
MLHTLFPSDESCLQNTKILFTTPHIKHLRPKLKIGEHINTHHQHISCYCGL